MTDDLTAFLKEIRQRGYRNGATGAECARLSDAAAVDVPLLVAALEAALENHEEFDGTCSGCTDAYGDPAAWPCPTYKAITARYRAVRIGAGRDVASHD